MTDNDIIVLYGILYTGRLNREYEIKESLLHEYTKDLKIITPALVITQEIVQNIYL